VRLRDVETVGYVDLACPALQRGSDCSDLLAIEPAWLTLLRRLGRRLSDALDLLGAAVRERQSGE
jgi:hypothetical protein